MTKKVRMFTAFGVFIMSFAAPCHVAAQGLVDHWTFDGHLESEVGDNLGLFTGDFDPTYVEGFDGAGEGAIRFDGIDDVVTVQRTVQDEMTLTCWVRTDVQQVNAGAQYWHGSGLIYADVPGGANDFGMSINGDKLTFGIGNPDMTVTSITQVTTGEWVHVAAVREIDVDLGVSMLRVYVDCALEAELEHPNTAPVDANANITIGGNTIDTRMYTGDVDDVRLYDVALTDEDIEDLCAEGPTGPTCPEAGDPDFGDTSCTGITVTGPPEGGPGQYLVSASGRDATGDDVLYLFNAESGAQTLAAGPQLAAETSFALGAGTWTISVSVDDSAACEDEAADATCTETIEIEPPEEELVDHWTFDGHLESEVSDNLGLFTGDFDPTYVEGFDGAGEGAILFDGIDDVVTVQRTVQDEMTLACWVRTEVQQVNAGAQYWHGSGLIYADVPGGANDFGMSINGDFLTFGIGNPDMTVTSSMPVTTGDWTHVAAVREVDPALGATVLRLYVDGIPDGELQHPNTASVDANANITIGGNTIDGRWYTGEIDDVRFYNFALTEDEINDIINEMPKPPPGDLFIRSDANSDAGRNLTDAVFVLEFLFASGGDPPCKDAADANDDGIINITDGVYILENLFSAGGDPPPPYPHCGEDPTADALDCATSQPNCDGG